MKYSISYKLFVSICLIICACFAANAQVPSGSSSVVACSTTYTYSVDIGATVNGPYWVINKGISTNAWSSGTVYYTEVVFTTTGSGSVRLYGNDGPQSGIKNVTITSGALGTPSPNYSTFSRCGGGQLVLQASPGSGGTNVKWYTTASGGTLLNTGTSYTVTLGGNITYYLASSNSAGCESSRVGASVTINAAADPNDLGGADVSLCGSGSATLTSTVTYPSTQTTVWYTQNTSGSYAGGGYIAVGNTYTTPPVSSTTTYYRSIVINATGCESSPASRRPISIVINPIPSPPTATTGASGKVCGSGTVTLSGSPGANGNTIRWYASSSGGGVLATSTSYSPSISSTTTYWMSTYNTTTGCESSSRTSTVGTVNLLPGTPTGTNGYGCKATAGSTTDVTISGTPGSNADNLKWYTRVNNEDTYVTTGTVYTTPQLNVSTTYYISSYNSTTGCESANKVAVIANVNGLPAAPTSPQSGYTCGPGPVSLSASPSVSGGQVYWYPYPSGSLLNTGSTFTPTVSTTTMYTAKTFNPATGCLSSSTVTVTATVKPQPNITVSGQTICSGSSSAITLTTDQPNTTYTFTTTPTNVTGPTNGSTTSNTLAYPLTVTNGNSAGTMSFYVWGTTDKSTPTECQGPAKTILINVNPVPTLSLVNNLPTICSTQNTSIVFSNPNNVSGTVYSWIINPTNVTGASAATNTTATNISQTLTSGGTASGLIDYSATASFTANGKTCTSSSSNTSVNVKPVPVASVPSGTYFNGSYVYLPLSSNISGTTFSYTTSAVNNILNATSGTANPIYQLISLADINNAGSVTYNVTPSYNGCMGAVKTGVAYLYPFPVITSTVPYLSFGNSATVSAQTLYDTYSWVRNSGTTTGVSSITTNQADNFTLTVSKNGTTATTPTFSLGYQLGGVNKNYIITNQLQFATSDANRVNVIPIDSLSQSISYMDGLGRPLQTVVTRNSPSKYDVVQPTAYDDFGREPIKYLPYVSSQTDGNFKVSPVGAGTYAGSPHSNYYSNGTADKVKDDSQPFAVTSFEASPLNRVLKQGAPGAIWQPDASSFASPTDRTIAYSYEFNAANEVLKWTYTAPTASYPLGLVNASTGATPVYYSINQLFKTRMKDEHHNEVIEFKNKQGQVILKKVQGPTEYAQTYYIYDDLNNLACVLPPEAVKVIIKTPTSDYFNQSDATKESFLRRWSFRYTYDSRNRMAQKQVPGADAVYMVYDNRDRLILTQDGALRATGTKYWSFTKYDELNRPVLTGIKDTAAAITQAQMQAVVNAHFAKASARWSESTGGTIHGYTNKAYPVLTDPLKYLTITYYDDYNVKNLIYDSGRYSFKNNELIGQTTNYNKKLRGLMTGRKLKVMDGNVTGGYTWLTTINYYDDQNRIIQTVSDNYKGGQDYATNVFDFTGKIMKSKTTHTERDVTWKDRVSALATGNRLATNSSSSGFGTSGAASVQQLAAGQSGWLEVVVSETTTQRMIGFNDANPDANFTNIDFALYLSGTTLGVYENGTSKYTLLNGIASGDVLRIERNGTAIVYKKNGVAFGPNNSTSNTMLMVDASFNHNTGVLVGVKTSFSTTTQSVTRRFEYDHAGRLTKTWHQLNAGLAGEQPEILLAKNEYNEMSQIIDKKMHSTNGTTFKQSMDYRYNIRGWLTSMNNSQLTSDGIMNDETNDLFGMQLGYENDLGTGNASAAQYNGNISGVKWSANLATGTVKEKAYNYSYDVMNRITAAEFRENSTAWTTATNSAFSENGYSYDLNGNIRTLIRKGKGGITLDDLTYVYGSGISQSNKLLSLTDNTGDKFQGFIDGTNAGTEYTYDTNGNMVSDQNKGVSSITYNYLNLPETVAKGGNIIRYVYDASGRKLGQYINEVNEIKQTDYVGEFEYDNDVLKSINHEEGRIVMSSEKIIFHHDGDVTSNATASVATVATVTQNSSQTYLSATAVGTTTAQGIFPVGGTFNVIAGERYRVRVKGYRTGSSLAYINVKANGVNLTWPGALIPLAVATEAWSEQVVTIPTGATTLEAGVRWNTVTNGEQFFINELDIIKLETTAPEYQYTLKDHLGNSRVTFTTKTSKDVLIATLEDNTQSTEQNTFRNYSRISFDLFDHTDAGTTYSYVQQLNGGSNSQIGLAKTLSVMPGDTVKAEVYAKYESTTGSSGNLPGFAAALLTAFGLPAPVMGEVNTAAAAINNYGGLIAAGNNPGNPSWPKGWLNVLVFDRNYNVVNIAFQQLDGAYVQTGSTKMPHQLLSRELVIKEPGYVYIYVSNEGNTQQNIYFDDMKVTHSKSPLIQTQDYYPLGLAFNSYGRENSVPNQYLYNGKELQDELSLGWLDYGARMYQPEMGRWGAIDPLSDSSRSWSPYSYGYNNAIRFIDPDGMDEDDVVVDRDKGERKATDDAFINTLANGDEQIANDLKSSIASTDKARKDYDKESKRASNRAGVILTQWVNPSSLKLKKVGEAWYGSAFIDEEIVALKLPNGIAYVHLSTIVNFDFSGRGVNKKLAQYLAATAMDRARASLWENLYFNPGMSSEVAAREFKGYFGFHLMDLTYGSEVKSYTFEKVPTFMVQFQWLPSFSPK